MKVTGEVTAYGATLDEVIKDAGKKITAFLGGEKWEVVSVDARPSFELAGTGRIALWRADVSYQWPRG